MKEKEKSSCQGLGFVRYFVQRCRPASYEAAYIILQSDVWYAVRTSVDFRYSRLTHFTYKSAHSASTDLS